MQAFTQHSGLVMPLDRANVDTDAIIPASYLKAITRTGFADGLFSNWRYLQHSQTPDPNFPLNMPRYQSATILITRENFGCGSSREHAPWALYEYGFRVLIAPSFADIFYNNCFNVGILPIYLAAEQVQNLREATAATPGYHLKVDLVTQTINQPGGENLPFEIEPARKEILLRGGDTITYTLQFQDEIAAYETRRQATTPWYVIRNAAERHDAGLAGRSKATD